MLQLRALEFFINYPQNIPLLYLLGEAPPPLGRVLGAEPLDRVVLGIEPELGRVDAPDEDVERLLELDEVLLGR